MPRGGLPGCVLAETAGCGGGAHGQRLAVTSLGRHARIDMTVTGDGWVSFVGLGASQPTGPLWPSGATPLGPKNLTVGVATLSPQQATREGWPGHSDASRGGLAVTTVCEVGHSVIYLTYTKSGPLTGLCSPASGRGGLSRFPEAGLLAGVWMAETVACGGGALNNRATCPI